MTKIFYDTIIKLWIGNYHQILVATRYVTKKHRAQNQYLMKIKETVNGFMHDRPFFYAFQDRKTQIYWIIPYMCPIIPRYIKNEYPFNSLKFLSSSLLRDYGD